jgi:hypothetical protein
MRQLLCSLCPGASAGLAQRFLSIPIETNQMPPLFHLVSENYSSALMNSKPGFQDDYTDVKLYFIQSGEGFCFPARK